MPFQKGNKLGGRTYGAKNEITYLKEERRAIFDREISQRWLETIRKLPATYIADQFMGVLPQEINIKSQSVSVELSGKLTEELKAELKQSLLNGTE